MSRPKSSEIVLQEPALKSPAAEKDKHALNLKSKSKTEQRSFPGVKVANESLLTVNHHESFQRRLSFPTLMVKEPSSAKMKMSSSRINLGENQFIKSRLNLSKYLVLSSLLCCYA